MSGSSNFLQFNPNKGNMMSDANYGTSSYRLNGCVSGLAPANIHNKLFYQTSIMTAALAQSLADKGFDVSDADFDDLVALLKNIATEQYVDNNGGLFKWTPQINYSVGDICYSKNASSYKRFECVVAGTTGASEPTWPNVGQMVSDGTTKWIVDDVRDGTPVGGSQKEHRNTPRPGYIKKNGALLLRADYPRLWKFAQESGLLVSEATWVANMQGCFSIGNGSTTFRIPEGRGEFERGWDDGRGINSGRVLGSNEFDAFQGHHHYLLAGKNDNPYYHEQGSARSHVGDDFTNNNTQQSVDQIRDARSDGTNGTPRVANETRPRNVALLACIKY